MLENLRNASKNWLGKAVITVLFSVLILSFAIWGIGDIFRGGVNTAVARVGNVDVASEAFRRQFQDRIQTLQQRQRGFTAEQARAFGIDRQILDQMIAEAALDQTARKLGMGLSEQEVAKQLASEPGLRGPDGRFDRERLENYLRSVGLNEAGLIAQQRQAALRRKLGDTLNGGLAPSRALLEAIHRYQNEERTVATLTIPGAIPASLAAPSEDVLKAFHSTRSGAFRAPEFRRIHVMTAEPKEFSAAIRIEDADLKAAYDRIAATGRFGTPEKRQLQQILFQNVTAANAASARLKDGLAFDTLLAEMKLSPADTDLGDKARGEIADKAIGDAAFALTEGGVSAPVSGAFGPVILRVTRITPGTIPPLETVRPLLEADLLRERLSRDRGVRDNVDRIYNQIEDLRSAGKTLEQVAGETKRPLAVIEAVDANGRDRAGNPVAPLPDMADVIGAVFKSDRGVDNEVIRARDGSYVWFEVMAVEAARDRTFEEVKAEVETQWRRSEAQRLTTEQAAGLLKRIEAGETLEAIATEINATVETDNAVRRTGGRTLSASAAAIAFTLAKDAVGVAAGNNLDRLLLKVTGSDTVPFDPNAAEAKATADQIRSTVSDEMLEAYVGALKADLGVTVDARNLALATGAQQR